MNRGMPHKGLGIRIGHGQVRVDCVDQSRDAVKAASSDALLGDLPKPPLHDVQPRRTGGGEVQVEPGMPTQPLLHSGLGVSPIVVQDHVQRHTRGKLPVQLAQEAQELLMSVSWQALSDHPSVQEVERRKQRRDPMPLVVVSHGSAAPLLHRQARLGALEGLDLAFLIHTQDNGLIGRVQVQPHDIGELLAEVPVLGELESPGPVGLKSMSAPNPLDGGLADALGLRHSAGAPVGGALGLGLGCDLHDVGNPLCGIERRPASAGFDLGQGIDATLPETLPPQDHRGARCYQLRRDTVIGVTVGGQQDNLCPKGNTLGSIWGPGPCFKGSALFIGHNERRSCIPHTNTYTS